MAIYLGDDGTMDTVIVCSDCGREYRFNYDPCPPMANDDNDEYTYDDFVAECISEIETEHDCNETEEE